MRTLHSGLTTAQQSSNPVPYINLVFDPRDRDTGRSYDSQDATNRILRVQQSEGAYGSESLVPGKPFVVSSVIRLQNDDNTLSSLDFKGWRVYIEWGYEDSGTGRTSRGQPEFVLDQEIHSSNGRVYLELYCANLWELNRLALHNTTNVKPTFWKTGDADNGLDVLNILQELFGGVSAGWDSSSPFTEKNIQRYDNGSAAYIDDFTVAASNASQHQGIPSTELSDVHVFLSPIQVGDYLAVGHTEVFDRASFDISDILSSGSITFVREYWNGSAWSTLGDISDTEGNIVSNPQFTATGLQIQSWEIPTDWATSSQNGSATLYFMRLRCSAVSSPSGSIEANRIQVGHDTAIAIDTAEPTQGDDFEPTYRTNIRATLSDTVQAILAYTELGLFVREDGFHAKWIDETLGTPDYTYTLGGDHDFFTHTEHQGVVIPNKISVVSQDPALGPAEFEGTASYSASITSVGTFEKVIIDTSITSNAEGNTRAGNYISQLRSSAMQGYLKAPMNCGQEVWDLITIDETSSNRTGNSSNGRVFQILRTFDAVDGNIEYTIEMALGGSPMRVGPTSPSGLWSLGAGSTGNVGPTGEDGLQDVVLISREVESSYTTGAGAIDIDTSFAKKFRLVEITLHLSAAGTTDENFTVKLDAKTDPGSQEYDTVLYSKSLHTDSITDLVLSGNDHIYESGDEFDIDWPNSESRTYGLRVVIEPI